MRTIRVPACPVVEPTAQAVAVRQAGQWVAFGEETQAVGGLLQVIRGPSDPAGVHPLPDDDAQQPGDEQAGDQCCPRPPCALLGLEPRGGGADESQVLPLDQRDGRRGRPVPCTACGDARIVGPQQFGTRSTIVEECQAGGAFSALGHGQLHPFGQAQDRHSNPGPPLPALGHGPWLWPRLDRSACRAAARGDPPARSWSVRRSGCCPGRGRRGPCPGCSGGTARRVRTPADCWPSGRRTGSGGTRGGRGRPSSRSASGHGSRRDAPRRRGAARSRRAASSWISGAYSIAWISGRSGTVRRTKTRNSSSRDVPLDGQQAGDRAQRAVQVSQ